MLVAEQSPGWAGWCVLSTGQSEPQHSAQKFAFCCSPLQDAPTPSSVVALQQTGPVSRGEANVFFLKSGSSVLNSGREFRVTFPPIALLFHLVPVLSSTQYFYASLWSCSCSSFIHVFLVLLCCFSSSLLLIALNRVSTETAAVSSTCNLSNPFTKFNCYCICNAALCGCSLAACNVSWILIKCFLAL